MEKYMKRWTLLLLTLLAGACSDATDPDDGGATDSELKFLRFSSANAVTVRTASFWAVRGRDRKLEIDYANGDEFLEFEVRSRSLLRRPDGTLFAENDSVLITVTLDPTDRIIVDFQPSGLTFSAVDPARLKINYQEADLDIDDDGDVDAADRDLEADLRVWQREVPGLPWLPLLTLRIDEDDVEARVLGFTGFAMASN